jgi:hypothetical protein
MRRAAAIENNFDSPAGGDALSGSAMTWLFMVEKEQACILLIK